MLRLPCRSAIWTLLGAGTVAIALLLPASLKAEPAPNREREIAYCNTEEFAIKVYTHGGLDPEVLELDALIRIYDRSDNLSFINRVPVSQQSIVENGIRGTAYENLRGENQWQLFMATNPGEGFDPELPGAAAEAGVHYCTLSRDGEVIAFGQGRMGGTVGGGGFYPGTPEPETPGGGGYYPGEGPSRPSSDEN